MSERNIVIFSDGTGQRGGILVDENRSNIYKLYRATRCGPESAVDPVTQLAFYNPGIGTLPPGAGFFGKLWRGIYNTISQALGLGLTGNIIDCYAALVRLWRPGDRIFLFGFSRGAYTIRCLAATICRCGLPTKMADGSPLLRDEATSKRFAKEAVRQVYQHTSSWIREKATPRQIKLFDQREALAKRFRQRYTDSPDAANVYPHFIGVFDTVASLSNPVALVGLVALTPVLTALIATFLWWLLLLVFGMPIAWWISFGGLTAAVLIGGYFLNLLSRIRVAFGLEGYPWYKTLHLAERRMNFYDLTLNPKVGFARHAISIDEARGSFQRVRWGQPGVWKQSTPAWFEQLWFAGNHSNIGGSYHENESRLSDISLQWMLDAATAVGLKHDPSLLRLYPDPTGPQHDETKSSVFKYASHSPRRIGSDFPLHPSVLERFKAKDVLQYDRHAPYRPENLREHRDTRSFY